VRLKKDSLRARVKGDLEIAFTKEPLTAHAGLELFGRFLRRSGFVDRLREVFADRRFDTDYGSWRMALLTIGLLVVGGTRLRHGRVMARDPLFVRFARLQRMPDERTLARWLVGITSFFRERLNELLREIAYATFSSCKLGRATLDFDGTVIRAGDQVDGAERGFNPHHPKDRSYYPLTGHLAQTGQILGVWNRPGNVNDSVEAVQHLEEVFASAREALGAIPFEVRLDGAFCQKAVFECLTASGVEYAVRVPKWHWLGIREVMAKRKRWKRIGPRLEAFSVRHRIAKWKRTERIVVFRKHVSGKPKKGFQLDLFQPDDGQYEYSMVATNKAVSERTVWDFMAGRGGHEKTLAELKQHLAFGSVVTQDWDANSTWQLLSAMTHNLVRQFQIEMGAKPRKNGRKRTYRFTLPSLRSFRFELLNLPGKIARPAGRTQLRIAAAPDSQHRIRMIERKLAA
jgi:hypothetical protein